MNCPFCDGNDLELRASKSRVLAWVRCCTCGATGPKVRVQQGKSGEIRCMTATFAFHSWNQRAGLPAITHIFGIDAATST